MAEYLIQDTTLTNLGNKIRVLSGSQDAMTPAAMASNVDEANTEVDTQTDLIAQILDVLISKGATLPAKVIPVAISGTGDSTYCVVRIGENIYTQAANVEVLSGDIISLGVYWGPFGASHVEINNEIVFTGDDSYPGYENGEVNDSVFYEWVVPNNINSIAIELTKTAGSAMDMSYDIIVTTSV